MSEDVLSYEDWKKNCDPVVWSKEPKKEKLTAYPLEVEEAVEQMMQESYKEYVASKLFKNIP